MDVCQCLSLSKEDISTFASCASFRSFNQFQCLSNDLGPTRWFLPKFHDYLGAWHLETSPAQAASVAILGDAHRPVTNPIVKKKNRFIRTLTV